MKVLVIGAHPDDEVIGPGGTIAKHIENGDEIFVILFSVGHKPIQPKLKEQAYKSLKIYGINKNNLFWMNCPSGSFDLQPKLKINSKLIDIFQKIKPQIVYTHFYGDLHQDHRFVFDATMVACRPIHLARGTKSKLDWCGVEKILCYEIPSSTNWSGKLNSTFNPTEFNILSKNHVDKKISAYDCYKDEVRPGNHPRSLDSLLISARYWGKSINAEYAEAFVTIRNINHVNK